jgi:hypothetical protein
MVTIMRCNEGKATEASSDLLGISPPAAAPANFSKTAVDPPGAGSST